MAAAAAAMAAGDWPRLQAYTDDVVLVIWDCVCVCVSRVVFAHRGSDLMDHGPCSLICVCVCVRVHALAVTTKEAGAVGHLYALRRLQLQLVTVNIDQLLAGQLGHEDIFTWAW